MKQILSKDEAAALLLADENASWSAAGAWALVEYVDDDDYIFNIVDLRIEYTEYASLRKFAEDYGGLSEAEDDGEIREFIQERGVLIEFEGGIIVSRF